LELWGNLKDFSLPDVIQLVGFGRKSGVLGVEHNGASARLFFQEGNVVHAEMGDLSGEDAVFMLFRLVEGEFRFRADLKPPAQTIFMDPTNLVMEAARLMDESARDSGEAKEKAAEAMPKAEAVQAVEEVPEKAASSEEEFSTELPEIFVEEQSASVLGYDSDDSYGIIAAVEEPEAPQPPARKVSTPAEIREELKVILEQKFGRESKRLLQAVEKCGDTLDEFQQLVTRVERFVSAFVDPKSASQIGDELRQIVSKLSS
jgi:hypothetical protein